MGVNVEIAIIRVEFRVGTIAKVSEIAPGHTDVKSHYL
jgi:hypothetical protein